MRVVIQRVKSAKVEVGHCTIGEIDQGLLIFLGVAKGDTTKEADFLLRKVTELRIFEDEQGKMNLSAFETQAEVLVVSQFTFYGDCRKGRRPSFDRAAPPTEATQLYQYFVDQLEQTGHKVQTGEFQAMMDVSLVNDGPVTLIIDTDK